MLCLPPERVAAPAVAPVTLAEAKAHLRVDDDFEDDRITAAIEGATGYLDGYTGILGRALIEQQWKQSFSFWPASRSFALALAPVIEIVSIEARDSAGGTVTIAGADYRLLAQASRPCVLLGLDTALPGLDNAPDAITITYKAGYGAVPTDVPAALRSAILLMVGDLFRFTESAGLGAVSAVPMSTTVDRLLAPYRRNWIS